jgi:hypothetical protein
MKINVNPDHRGLASEHSIGAKSKTEILKTK